MVDTEDFGGIEGAGVGQGHAHARGLRRSGDGSPCRLDHRRGHIETVTLHRRISPRDLQQIPSGTAADFQDRTLVRRRQIPDQEIAAKQVGLARHIIDMTLEAID